MKLKNGLLMPETLLERDPAKALVTERERVDLVRSIAKVLREIPLHQLNAGVHNMHNAMGATLPGTVSIADALGVTIACAATLAGSFLEQLGAATEDRAEGHIQACREAFEQVMRAHRRGREALRSVQGPSA